MPLILCQLVKLVLLALAVLAAASVQARPQWLAENYLLDRWTNVEGLPVNGTTDVLMGRRGYLWLATFDGLVRFDGQRFKTFRAGAYPGMPGNRLTRLIQQESGLIWLLTEQFDLASFDGQVFHAAAMAEGLPGRRVLKLHLDSKDRLWLGTDQGLARACGPACFRVIGGENLDDQAVQAFADGTDDEIWVGTASGELLRVGKDGVEQVLGARSGLRLDDIRAVAVDKAGTVFAGGRGGLARIEGTSSRMLRAVEGGTINDLEVAPDGDLIAQSYKHRWRLRDGDWQVIDDGPIAGYVRLVASGPDGSEWRVRQRRLLKDGEPVVQAPCPIRDFDFDQAGGVWLATLCDGLWRVRQRQFDTITTRHGLPDGPVYGMVEDDDGRLWASVAAGLLAEIQDGVVERVHDVGFPGQVLGTVAATRAGRLVVGQGGLCVMSGTDCKAPGALPEALRTAPVRSVIEDHGGVLWVGSQAGLWRRRGDEWRSMQAALSLPDRVQVQVVFQAEGGNLWFGTDSAGLRLRTAAGSVRAYGWDDGLASDRIRDLHQDADGHLWVVTADSGVCRSDQPESRSGLSFECLDVRQGLYANSLHRLLADDQGRYWFNSNSGVFWVHRHALERVLDDRTERIYPRVYTEGDGLPDREGNGGVQNAGIRLRDGRLAFPGQGGIAVFDPERVQALQGAPKVIIEQLLLADGTSLPTAGTVRLPLGERVFSARITGIKPGLTGQTYFRYRFDQGPWVEVGDDRNLVFDSIRPGRHTLEIAAIDADSGLSGPIARTSIVVPFRFLERADVRVSFAALLLLLVAAWLSRRHRAAIRLQQYLHREVERRTTDALRRQRRAGAPAPAPAQPDEPESNRAAARTLVAAQPLADEVRYWIEQNVHRSNLSVAALAEALHMSRSKLHRRLVDEIGRSPGEFIRDVRLGLARRMLQNTDASVSDVAYSVGFSSVTGFSRAYRNHFGESPSRTG